MLAHLFAIGIALLYLGVEQALTRGQMAQSAFLLPAGPFRTILRGDWPHVAETFAIVAKKMIGYIALAGCCGLFLRRLRADRMDRLLLIYLAAEVLALFPLFYNNLGAADNYAFQAVVFAGILMGRCLARALDDPESWTWGLAAAGLASLMIAARDFQFVELAWRTRTADRTAIREMIKQPPVSRRDRDEIYFVDRPEHNRLFGSRSLAHDEFAHGEFEAAGAAEPRSSWLKSALESGKIHVVVVPDGRTTVIGLRETLPELGYEAAGRYGDYRVWECQTMNDGQDLKADARPDAGRIIDALGLKPHPIEGGFFRETYRSEEVIPAAALPASYQSRADRSYETAIYYLLTADTFSEMHRLPTEEVFHLYLGGPMRMLQLFPDGTGREVVIGPDVLAGQQPQVVVPPGVWQGSRLEPGVEFVLLGATMAPGFDYADYEQGGRADLMARYPDYADAIRELTRIP